MANENFVVLASAVRAATNSSAVKDNYAHRGGHFIIDVTVVPGTDTVTPKIEGYDPRSGKYYTILEGAAIVATGTTILKVYPGIGAVANGAASDVLPPAWRVTMTHSAASDFTYSVSANLVM